MKYNLNYPRFEDQTTEAIEAFLKNPSNGRVFGKFYSSYIDTFLRINSNNRYIGKYDTVNDETLRDCTIDAILEMKKYMIANENKFNSVGEFINYFKKSVVCKIMNVLSKKKKTNIDQKEANINFYELYLDNDETPVDYFKLRNIESINEFLKEYLIKYPRRKNYVDSFRCYLENINYRDAVEISADMLEMKQPNFSMYKNTVLKEMIAHFNNK